jgi:AcrR family transcriptional regulator
VLPVIEPLSPNLTTYGPVPPRDDAVSPCSVDRASRETSEGLWQPALVFPPCNTIFRSRTTFYLPRLAHMSNRPIPAEINPPKQSRSRRTLERIVAASLELLATEGPDGLTVHKVVAKADSSVGSFYARFKGKDDLLDYLGERIWTEALARWNAELTSRDWSDYSLAQMVEGAVGLLIDAQRSRSAYLKALDRAGGAQGHAYDRFQTELLAGLSELLLQQSMEIAHDDPQRAVRLGLRAALGVIDAEYRAVVDRLPQDVLLDECRVLVLGYLTGSDGRASAATVEFFDVWG